MSEECKNKVDELYFLEANIKTLQQNIKNLREERRQLLEEIKAMSYKNNQQEDLVISKSYFHNLWD